MPKKKKKEIQIVLSISGGIVEVESKPDGISILLKDYDIDGTEESGLKRDKYGRYNPVVFPAHYER
jgi:hypothetical protein